MSLVHRSERVQLFAFRPEYPHGRHSSYGITLRIRLRRSWRHFTIRLHERARPHPSGGGRGCFTYEIATHRSEDLRNLTKRGSIKAFVRLRVGLGGERGSR